MSEYNIARERFIEFVESTLECILPTNEHGLMERFVTRQEVDNMADAIENFVRAIIKSENNIPLAQLHRAPDF